MRYSDFREEFQRVINLDPRWRLPISATSIQVVWTDNSGLERQRQIKRQRQMFANISHLNPGGIIPHICHFFTLTHFCPENFTLKSA